MSGLAPWLNLVRFSHSIFALPFALCGAWLAAGGPPPLFDLLLIVLCAVSARTAAMGFNRLVDRHIDRRNPRTAARELPAGVLTPLAVGALVLFSSALFFLGAFALNPLAGYLATPVLAVLLGYSLVKRFHWCAHGVLGLALALAPLGAWVAVRGAVDGDAWPVLTLALAVWTWVAGFDLIYACQDADFDRGAGLHSIPGRFGVAAALSASAALHVVTVVALLGTAFLAGLGLPFLVALALASALLVWEHRLVRPDDLSRVDAAFFTINGWVSVALFLGLALDLAL
ncbi:MAG: UbiA-like polyprenyltransferase [Planctomycetota bacterium]|nr:UbiA-like polyprenyltransferase [Planctomycetota bacterium]